MRILWVKATLNVVIMSMLRKKAQDVFYNPEIATKEIIDDVFDSINDRNKLN